MPIDASQDGPWRELFLHAMTLMSALPITDPPQQWTFGGGTVLMLRYRHRLSKDIDLFVRDPQVLGYLNPRLSPTAESITTEYDEAAEYLKLYLPQGEIDIVVSNCLLSNAYEATEIMGHRVFVETAAEIIAKKMFFRGDKVKGRDLFDLSLVIENEPDALILASKYLLRHRDKFIDQLKSREAAVRNEFEAIETLEYNPSFDEVVERVRNFLSTL